MRPWLGGNPAGKHEPGRLCPRCPCSAHSEGKGPQVLPVPTAARPAEQGPRVPQLHGHFRVVFHSSIRKAPAGQINTNNLVEVGLHLSETPVEARYGVCRPGCVALG